MNLDVIETFEKEINLSNSRNYKIQVLQKYKNTQDIKDILYFVFNPYITTGLSEKKINKVMKSPVTKRVKTFDELIKYIRENNTGRDESILTLQDFMSNLSDSKKELVKHIIGKNWRLGIETKTINKVFNDLIPTFNVQLAHKYFDNPEIVEGKEFSITTKIDGGRIAVLKEDGVVKCFTRAGQEYEGLVDIVSELENMKQDNFMLDGEITLLNKGNLTSKEQYQKTMQITRRDGIKHGVKILAFDLLPIYSFKAQHSSIPYTDRRKKLEENFSGCKFIDILPVLYSGKDTSMITKLLKSETDKGEEGVMININNAPYSFGRAESLLKVKKMQDVDLEVIELEEGRGRHSGSLGAFIVEYKGNKVKVGSGISDEIRKKVWKNPKDYIGLTITVQYFEETHNKSGGTSLRFPVFLDFRYDK